MRANAFRHVEVTSEGTMVVCTAPEVTGDSVPRICEATFQDKPAQRRMTETARGSLPHMRAPDAL